MTRVVGHLDLDYFYAQVEEVEVPSLRGLPVVVCVFSGRTEESGVVSTANYRARAAGVKSGMPIAVAKKRLTGSDAAFVPMTRAKYEAYSARIMEALRARVDILEQTGIDEAFFDITEKVRGDFDEAERLAGEIKKMIYEGEKLTCSIGLAQNKVVAKIASDFKKPDGLTVVRPHQVHSFLDPLDAKSLYGVGTKTAEMLRDNGISTIGALARTNTELLERLFGRRLAAYLHDAANGQDEEAVEERAEATQISRIITLRRNSDDPSEILAQLSPAVEDVQKKAVTKESFFRSISIIGILTDLSIRSKSKTLETGTNNLSVLNKSTQELLVALVKENGALRRVGVRVADLTKASDQASLTEFVEG